jgi:hypothetical protein
MPVILKVRLAEALQEMRGKVITSDEGFSWSLSQARTVLSQ